MPLQTEGMSLYKRSYRMPLCAKRKRNDLPSDKQVLSTAKLNSCHVLSPLRHPFHSLCENNLYLYSTLQSADVSIAIIDTTNTDTNN